MNLINFTLVSDKQVMGIEPTTHGLKRAAALPVGVHCSFQPTVTTADSANRPNLVLMRIWTIVGIERLELSRLAAEAPKTSVAAITPYPAVNLVAIY